MENMRNIFDNHHILFICRSYNLRSIDWITNLNLNPVTINIIFNKYVIPGSG